MSAIPRSAWSSRRAAIDDLIKRAREIAVACPDSCTLLPALADALEAERKRAAEQGDVLRKVAAAFNGWANGSNQGDLATLTALEMIGAALGDPLKGQQP